MGAPGMSTAKYQALKPGKAEIILEYKRVFEDKPAAKTVKINVVVTSGTQTTQPGNAKVYRSPTENLFLPTGVPRRCGKHVTFVPYPEATVREVAP